jgi:hypothetical protein
MRNRDYNLDHKRERSDAQKLSRLRKHYVGLRNHTYDELLAQVRLAAGKVRQIMYDEYAVHNECDHILWFVGCAILEVAPSTASDLRLVWPYGSRLPAPVMETAVVVPSRNPRARQAGGTMTRSNKKQRMLERRYAKANAHYHGLIARAESMVRCKSKKPDLPGGQPMRLRDACYQLRLLANAIALRDATFAPDMIRRPLDVAVDNEDAASLTDYEHLVDGDSRDSTVYPPEIEGI